jgi:hypothetical protein
LFVPVRATLVIGPFKGVLTRSGGRVFVFQDLEKNK